MSLREDIEREAAAAGAAVAALSDDGSPTRSGGRGARARAPRRRPARERRQTSRVRPGSLDAGTLDRLRLDEARVEALARQIETMAEIEPLEREAAAWTLPNGLRVSERRIPIGTVGANFEARPNVALDVAGQLLKSLNTARAADGRRGAAER